ncbi:MAG: septum formation protein Maf [Lachnospiraceae bacterium]|nr:septum formation protein Maf [Lachnospiraceae bacterium]
MTKLILASASPRRIELLHRIGMDAEVRPVNADETIPEGISPDRAVEELSSRKAHAAAKELPDEAAEECVVIGADTVVSAEGMILGKPADEEDACRMLKMLSGAMNTVYTGVTLLYIRQKQIRKADTFSVRTDVYAYPLEEEEIQSYIRSGEPMDKAGAYGIQGIFGRYIEKIEGDYNNVVGLPTAEVYQHLKRMLP